MATVYSGSDRVFIHMLNSSGEDMHYVPEFPEPSTIDYVQANGGYIVTDIIPMNGDVYNFEVCGETADFVEGTNGSLVFGNGFTSRVDEYDGHAGLCFCTTFADRQVNLSRGTCHFWNAQSNAGNWIGKGFTKFSVSIGTSKTTCSILENDIQIPITLDTGDNDTIDSSIPLGIFCSIGSNGSANLITPSKFKLKYFQVVNGNVERANLKPFLQGSSVGLKDTVSGKFYRATGSIIYG